MIKVLYDVMFGSEVIASDMELDTALMLVEIWCQKYYKENRAISIVPRVQDSSSITERSLKEKEREVL